MKSLTLTAVIIVIAALFVIPSVRDQRIDDRFQGEPFPEIRPEHAFQSAELQPAVGRSSESNAQDMAVRNPVVAVVPQDTMPGMAPFMRIAPKDTTDVATDAASAPVLSVEQIEDDGFDFGLTSPSSEESGGATSLAELPSLLDVESQSADFGMRFTESEGKLLVSDVTPDRAADAYGVQKDDVLLLLDNEKLTSEIDFDRVATRKMAGDTASLVLLRGNNVVAIDDMQLGADGKTVKPHANYVARMDAIDSLPPDHRDALLANPFDQPIAGATTESTAAPIARDQLARIYAGQPNGHVGDESSRVAFNPYTSSNQGNDDTALRAPRPVAIPRFDDVQTSVQTNSLGSTEARSISPSDSSSQQSIGNAPEPLTVKPEVAFTAEELPGVGEPTLAEEPEPTEASANDPIRFPVPTSVQSEQESGSGSATTPQADLQPAPSPVPVPVPTLVPTTTPETDSRPAPKVHMPAANPAPAYTPVATAPSHHVAPSYVAPGTGNCPGGCAPRYSYCGQEPELNVGGWLSGGYHSASNDLFNQHPDNLGLHQGWLYAERNATATDPVGFRFDVMYGLDARDTQAFGNNAGEYDFANGFDFGSYGWALPQAYVELVLGEWNIRAGHFYTLLGYESVGAPNNFFYSHAMTMYNSEPFTHTGVLLNRQFGDFDVFAGWTLGWDTGFDQFGGGSSWLGGATYSINDCASLAYFSTAGDFGRRGSEGYSQSVVLDLTLTDNVNYVVQSDYLRIGSTGEDNVGVSQYVTYTLSDKVAVGSRVEWWKGDVLTGYAPHGGTLPAAGSLSYYATTFGLNIRPTDDWVLRPEVRHDWSPAADYDETYFGIDAIWSF